MKVVEFGTAQFEIVDVEDVTIKLKDIAVLIARSAEFLVDLKGQDRISSRIDATGQPGSIRLSGTTGSIDASLQDVVRMKRVDQTFMQRLDGTVSAGYSYTSGSGIGRFSFLEAAVYATENNEVFQQYSTVFTYGDDADGADRVEAGLGELHAFRGRYLVGQYVQYQTIASTGIDWRWVSISAGGVRVLHRRHVDLNALSGVTLTKERVTTGESSDLEVEWPLMLMWKLAGPAPKILVTGRAVLSKSLSVSDRYRLDARLAVDYEIYKHSSYGTLTLGTQVLYNRDSKPITAAQKQKDLNVSFNIGYTF